MIDPRREQALRGWARVVTVLVLGWLAIVFAFYAYSVVF